MATKYTTKNEITRVYNLKGTQSGTINGAGITLSVFAFNVLIPERGECYLITSPQSGYVKEADVKSETVADPPPPDPEPSPNGLAYSVTISLDGYLPSTIIGILKPNA